MTKKASARGRFLFFSFLCIFAIPLAAQIRLAQARSDWWNANYRYRVPVQLKNPTEQIAPGGAARVWLPSFRWLIQAGKLRADASDARLVDEQKKEVAMRVAFAGNSSKTGAILFEYPAIPARGRKIFYLYYGNKNAGKQTAAAAISGNETAPAILITTGSEEDVSGKIDLKPTIAVSVDEWLKRHKPEEFTGKIWARARIDTPKNYFYNIVIDSETDPYKPARTATGTLSYYGLQPKPWAAAAAAEGNDWMKPLPWIPPTDDTDWLPAGQYSAWVELPISKAAQWHTAFFVRLKPDAQTPAPKLDSIGLRLEFATEPSEDFLFHAVEEKTDETGAAVVRMPTTGGIEGLKMVESFTEWARRRRSLVLAQKLTEPPRLNKLKIGTWATLNTYRAEGGNATRERAEPDFQNFLDLGINSVTANGLSDQTFAELAPKYGITDTTVTAWANNWIYSNEAANKLYDYQPGETPETRLARIFDDFYSRQSATLKNTSPFAYSLATHINLGDEIMAATTATEIRQTPPLLKYFREWLSARKLAPADFGAKSWEEVFPTDDRAKLNAPNSPVENARNFYHTRQFINHYTALYYRKATEAVKKYYPKSKLVAVNYQAGPMQFGFVGNDNDLDKGQLDFFEMGRERALQGVMMEDWVHGWDLGIGREALAIEMMRAAARKHDLPLASYLVGGEAVRAEFFGFLMRGVRENGLYLYGPISNIGPAWSESSSALAQIADTTRRVEKFENLIAQATPRPAKVALLVAATSDIMQARGLYFAPERQNIFVALQHNYVPLEIVSEQDVLLDERLKDYSLLIVTDPQVRSDVQRKIAGWVKDGGRLWASIGAAEFDEYNQPSRILNDVFGVRERKTKMPDGGFKFSAEAWSDEVSKFDFRQLGTIKTDASVRENQVTEIPVFGAKLDANSTTAQIVGTYEDGKPAIFLNRYGKGEAMLFGALLGEAYVRAHYPPNLISSQTTNENWKFELGAEIGRVATLMAKRTGIEQPVELSVPGIYTSLMEAPGAAATLVFLNNATGKPLAKVTIRVRGVKNVKRVQSTRQDKIDYRVAENGEVVLDIPLENAEILCLF